MVGIILNISMLATQPVFQLEVIRLQVEMGRTVTLKCLGLRTLKNAAVISK